MWFRCFTPPNNGWRAGPISTTRPTPRCSAMSPKLGGASRRPREATLIVGEGFRTAAAAAHPDLRTPLDEFVRRAAQGRPQAIALMDPPDRESFSDGAPRHLTWAAADRIVSAIANLLRSFGLPADAIVALQLPNTAEGVLALLGVLRAGLIAAPLPLLWRQAEMCAAVSRVGARALITTRRVGTVDHANIAMHVAAETFAIRFVCSFGHDLPDGVIPLDDVFD